jgi:hypothetical protein
MFFGSQAVCIHPERKDERNQDGNEGRKGRRKEK